MKGTTESIVNIGTEKCELPLTKLKKKLIKYNTKNNMWYFRYFQ